MPSRHRPPFLVLAVLVGACHGRVASPERPFQARESTAAERVAVSVTVYNGNFGVLREVRRVNLGLGKVALALRDVPEQIEPESVRIRSLTSADALTVREQNFRYDLLTPDKLLEKYVGRRVTLHRDAETLGGEQTVQAEVLAVDGNAPVFRIAGETTSGVSGRIAFPDVPPTLDARPTLVVLLDSSRATQEVEVDCLTKKLNWRADYALRLDEQATRADLQGWVTLTNGSGGSYENAKVKLVAGDLHRLAAAKREQVAEKAESKPPARLQWSEQQLFEYHEYTLDRPTSLLDHEQKQVLLLEASGVKTAKRFVFENQLGAYRVPVGRTAIDSPTAVVLEIENSKPNHLGFPLPAGTVHVYVDDATGEPQAIGEDTIDHTSRDETFRVRVGNSSLVRADRTQLSLAHTDSGCGAESEWEVALRNHRESQEVVEVVERPVGDWELLSSSQPVARRAARAFMFRVDVPAQGEAKIRYRVRVRWCRR